MNGWAVNPVRLRALREEAELQAVQMAEAIPCHPNHYRKFEVHPPHTPPAQPSAAKMHAIARVLTLKLGRRITFADFADKLRREEAAA